MNRDFWADESRWPRDHTEHVFLARAVQTLGAAMHPDAWTGREAIIQFPRVLQPAISANYSERLFARSLLTEERPDIEIAPVVPSTTGSSPPMVEITQEQWNIAREISRRRFETVKPTLKRLSDVIKEIEQQAASGSLRTAHRALQGGDFLPAPTLWWNTERTAQRFALCQINPKDPFGVGMAGDNYRWIFVSRTDLERLCASHGAHAQTILSKDTHLSPYMNLMILVAKQLKITPDNQPKKDVVVAALTEAWPKTITRSEKLIESMATLLREPDSQLGRAKKNASRVSKG